MARILIVDDEPLNRELLVAYLDDLGHELLVVESGEQALAVVASLGRPDLVLLDVMMRGMDGHETTRRLKALAPGEFLPIVLVTASHGHAALVTGLSAGADEFLTKPVDRHELLLRVNNLLMLRSNTIALAQRNQELVELQRFRDEMSALLVHDLKNPMTVVQLNLEFACEQLADPAACTEALNDARGGCKRVMRLIENLLDLVRLEADRLALQRAQVDVAELVGLIVQASGHRLREREITLIVPDAGRVHAMVDADLVSRVIDNLLDNAVRYTPRGGRIELAICGDASATTVRVGNSGPPVPTDRREQIFEKFGQASPGSGRMNLGLGLYFCRLVAEAHGGHLRLEETADLPTVFALTLPTSVVSASVVDVARVDTFTR